MTRRKRNQAKYALPIVLAAVLVVLLVIAVVGALKNSNFNPQNNIVINVVLNGEETVTVEYGQDFTDAGASAFWHNADEPDENHPLEVQVDNQVDLKKVGEYTVTYWAEYQGARVQKIRKVLVVDTQAPVIELVKNPDYHIPSVEEYEEEGFTATDNYDGDITDKVQRTVSGTKIIYTVTDSSGNKTEVVRLLPIADSDAPVLTLKGESSITITAGTEWSEPGYSAVDEVDGDVTDKVTVSGTVNHRIAGTYTLTYQVSDQYGNTASVERKVIVKAVPKPDVEEPDGEGKIIYLTFDDGPSKHTVKLLEVLDKYGIKATFFVCNTGRLDLLDDIANAGHTIGIHSNTHEYSEIYASDDAFFKDFYAMRNLIIKYSGVEPTISRFPGGSSNGVSKKHNKGIMTRLTQAVQDLGYQYFDWNIDSNDAGGTKTAEGVYQNVIKGISNSKQKHLVVLQHDSNSYSVDAVEQIIIWGLDHGYTFAALTNSSPVCHHKVNN